MKVFKHIPTKRYYIIKDMRNMSVIPNDKQMGIMGYLEKIPGYTSIEVTKIYNSFVSIFMLPMVLYTIIRNYVI